MIPRLAPLRIAGTALLLVCGSTALTTLPATAQGWGNLEIGLYGAYGVYFPHHYMSRLGGLGARIGVLYRDVELEVDGTWGVWSQALGDPADRTNWPVAVLAIYNGFPRDTNARSDVTWFFGTGLTFHDRGYEGVTGRAGFRMPLLRHVHARLEATATYDFKKYMGGNATEPRRWARHSGQLGLLLGISFMRGGRL